MNKKAIVKACELLILTIVIFLAILCLEHMYQQSSTPSTETSDAQPTFNGFPADAVILTDSQISFSENAYDICLDNSSFSVNEKNSVLIDRPLDVSNAPICRYSLIQGEHSAFVFFRMDISSERDAELLCHRALLYRKYFPIIIFGNISEQGAQILKNVGKLTEHIFPSFKVFTSNADFEFQDESQALLFHFTPCEKVLDLHKKMIALTFDDGPNETNTPLVLDQLKQYGAAATFFVNGSNVSQHPQIVSRIFEDGHEIGNHTNLHEYFSENTPSIIKKTINETNNRVRDVIGIGTFLVRPPGGECYDRNGVFVKIGYPIILWKIDTLDYTEGQTVEAILNSIKSAEDGDIVLMHDVHQITAEATGIILQYLFENGFQTVTVSELMEFSGNGAINDTILRDTK